MLGLLLRSLFDYQYAVVAIQDVYILADKPSKMMFINIEVVQPLDK